MKAIIWTKFGSPDGLEFQEVANPTIKDNEILIRVRATTVSAGDCEIRALKFPGWIAIPLRLYVGITKPRVKILGQELAGDVEAIGKDVTRFKVGDPVFGITGLHFGGYAEYVALSEKTPLAIKPAHLTYDQAAALPVGGTEALHFMRKAAIQPGEKVLIYGAGGSIGTYAIQLARYFGAGDITAVDSAEKLDMLRAVGANHTLDYTKTDFTQTGETYDVILDVVGKSSFPGSIKALNPNGRFMCANPSFSQMLRGTRTLGPNGQKIIVGPANPQGEDLLFLAGLVEAGKLKPVIENRFPLEQTADAHRYAEAGHKQGNLIITV
ncbi:MAG: NAD(P)-dependent alcohol dehydrogenase [Chloroflexota bacterium]